MITVMAARMAYKSGALPFGLCKSIVVRVPATTMNNKEKYRNATACSVAVIGHWQNMVCNFIIICIDKMLQISLFEPQSFDKMTCGFSI